MTTSIKNMIVSDELEFLGFALTDCTVETTADAAKYLRAVHRTALELALQNQFGAEVGGFWLMKDQIAQLRKLPLYYSAEEGPRVRSAVEDYLAAQTGEFSEIKIIN
jgi:hypothetical protein